MNRVMVISSDGHATGRVHDYRPYIDPAYLEEFDAFCQEFNSQPRYAFDPEVFRLRADADVVDEFTRNFTDRGRFEGKWDPERRLLEMDKEGIAADVVFPDFGRPFELYSATQGAQVGAVERDRELLNVSNRAYNRWLADFCSIAPERFGAMALIEFDDIDAAIREMQWVREAGFRGVICPAFEDDLPLYDSSFDRIWSAMEDLGLILNSHGGMSSTSRRAERTMPMKSIPHIALTLPLLSRRIEYFTHEILDHLILCGVLDRHPRLKVVFTEQGSGWARGKLASMDYTWQGSYARRDMREVVKLVPSEYFERQCWLGSSLLSRHEIAARHEIGLDKIMIGTDFPHLEGMFNPSVRDYLQATLGVNHVPEDEARMMLGTTIAEVFNFDTTKLQPIADRIGPYPDEILTEPAADLYPWGDVHKPAAGALV